MNKYEMEMFQRHAEDLIITCCNDCYYGKLVTHCKICTGYVACTHPLNSGSEHPINVTPSDCPLLSKPFKIENVLVYDLWIKKMMNKIPFEEYIKQKANLQKKLCFHAMNPNISIIQ